VRRDVDLEKVGTVAELPQDSSPVQLGTTGVYGNTAFEAVGRILYEYEQGVWNEWHLAFSDGRSGWLSDAMAQYAVTFHVAADGLPAADAVRPGQRFQWNGVVYTATTLTRARYRGVEGDLPFEYWDKEEALFADLQTDGARLGTLDYSGDQPLLFLGEAVEFDALQLKNLKAFEGWS
jgi:hypothetical protein